jgi:hypothetical protein
MVPNGDGWSLRVALDVAHEGAVDLQVIDREQLEVGERGVAGAEVVDGQRDAHAPSACENDDGFLRVFHDRAFGDFQFQQWRRQLPRPTARSATVSQKSRIAQLAC